MTAHDGMQGPNTRIYDLNSDKRHESNLDWLARTGLDKEISISRYRPHKA